MKRKKINTKPIPIMITLLAAGISCVASVLQGVSFEIFTMRLLGAVIVFGIFGIVVRVVLDRSFKAMEPEQTEEDSEETSEAPPEESRTEDNK